MRLFYHLILILLIVIPVKAGGFDDLGNSARAVSLGGAYIAVADAPYAVFYNPAGIHRLKTLNLSTTYSNLYPGVVDDNLNYFAFSGVIPMSFLGELGVGATFLNSQMWQENMLIGTYAREIYKSFAVGGSFKLMRWASDPAPGEEGLSYIGFTFDAGAHYTLYDVLEQSDLRIGFAARNITQPSIANNGNSDANLPMQIGVGLAFVSHLYNYLVALDAVMVEDTYMIKTGAEFTGLREDVFGYRTAFLIRAGYDRIIGNSVYKQSGINGGFGLNVENLSIDYAYVFPLELEQVGGSHKLSLSYNFNL